MHIDTYIYTYIYIYMYIHICMHIYMHIYMIKMDLTYETSVTGMGWLRLVGSLKLQVSFTKEPYKRDNVLQKRPIILRSLLIVTTP